MSIWTPAHRCSDSLQHRAAGWRFIDWNEVEQRELLAEAKCLLETGELFPRGTAEEPHAPDAEAEATDSEPEARVLEPPADDHSSDGEDTPLVSRNQRHQRLPLLQSQQPCVCLGGCKQSVSYTVASHQRDSISLRSQQECGAQSGTRSQGITSASPARALMSVSIASMSTLVGSERVVVCCCFLVHPFCMCTCCFSVSSRSPPVPSLAPM